MKASKYSVIATILYDEIRRDALGLYAWVNPDEQATIKLMRLLRSAPCKTYSSTELHCTLMFTKDELPAAINVPKDREMNARLAYIDNWVDHKGRVILVGRLESTDLAEVHNGLVADGLKHSYPDYNPHITIAKDVRLDDDLLMWLASTNARLRLQEFNVTFDPRIKGSSVT